MATDTDSSDSNCICPNAYINISEAQELVQEAIMDLVLVKGELELQLTGKCVDPTMRACKITTAMVKLQGIDDRLSGVWQQLQCTPEKENDLESNFGVSVKLDMAQEKVRSLKDKHENLRKEWYSQNEHLNKLAMKVNEKERELRQQSSFCTTQGLILSRMIWKLSNCDAYLDKIVSYENLTLEVIKVFAGCLYGFARTYIDEMPDPSADEYQYVVCMAGIFSNLGATPDGRFLLLNQRVCLDVLDEIVKILPKILAPSAENLKWILLSTIYNIMICKEGESYAKSNFTLIKSLDECIKPDNSSRIVTLALKIMSKLTTKTYNVAYLRQISRVVSINRLRELENSIDSMSIRKHAKRILSSISLVTKGQEPKIKKPEKLLRVTHLNESTSKCNTKCASTATERNRLAYQVLINPEHVYTKSEQHGPRNKSSSSNSSSLSDDSLASGTKDSHLKASNFASYTPRTPEVFLPMREKTKASIHTVPSKSQQHVLDYISTQFAEKATSTDNARIRKPDKLVKATEAPSEDSISEAEIRCVQYQLPVPNLNQAFVVPIGDTTENSKNRNSAVTAFRDGRTVAGDTTRASIVTVYQISGSRAILFSENSFAPICTQTSTEYPTGETVSKDEVTSTKAPYTKSTKSVTPNTVTVQTNLTESRPFFDINCKYSQNQKSSYTSQKDFAINPDDKNILDMPSTSTGLYEFGKPFPYIVPIDDRSSSMIEFSNKPPYNDSTRCKNVSKKNAGKCQKIKTDRKAKIIRPSYKIYRRH